MADEQQIGESNPEVPVHDAVTGERLGTMAPQVPVIDAGTGEQIGISSATVPVISADGSVSPSPTGDRHV